MKVSEIRKIMIDCDRLRDILLQNKHELTDSEIQEICYIYCGITEKNFWRKKLSNKRKRMIKTYCDICGKEITSLDNLAKLVAERRAEHAYHT